MIGCNLPVSVFLVAGDTGFLAPQLGRIMDWNDINLRIFSSSNECLNAIDDFPDVIAVHESEGKRVMNRLEKIGREVKVVWLTKNKNIQNTMKAIETTGIIDKQHRLVLDEILPIAEKSKVRVIILLPEESDIGETEWIKTAASNPAFDFLKEPEEDIYTKEDGKPFHDKG